MSFSCWVITGCTQHANQIPKFNHCTHPVCKHHTSKDKVMTSVHYYSTCKAVHSFFFWQPFSPQTTRMHLTSNLKCKWHNLEKSIVPILLYVWMEIISLSWLVHIIKAAYSFNMWNCIAHLLYQFACVWLSAHYCMI